MSPQIRLISEEGIQVGILDLNDAINLANEKGLDLVEINPNASPPICKLLDYKKFIFEKKKKTKELQKKGNKVFLKEIKLRPNISDHDYHFKLKHILNFIDKRHKVKITLNFKGRELAHMDLGDRIINNLKRDLEGKMVIEKEPKLEGRQIVMYISPLKKNSA